MKSEKGGGDLRAREVSKDRTWVIVWDERWNG